MKCSITLENRPIGYALEPANEGEQVRFRYRGNAFSSQGRSFIRLIEGLPDQVIRKLPGDVKPSEVSSLVVQIDNDLNALIHLNEPEMKMNILAKPKDDNSLVINKGDAITKEQLLHVYDCSFEGIDFDEDKGYFVLINHGWERIYIYDFGPLLEGEKKSPIRYNVSAFIASSLSEAFFWDLYGASDEEWKNMSLEGWFPFTFLTYAEQLKLFDANTTNNDKGLVDAINNRFEKQSEHWKSKIISNSLTAGHQDILIIALEHHLKSNYLESIHILYPRLEAILRSNFIRLNPNKKGRKQKILAENVTSHMATNTHSVSRYFPDRFGQYLINFFFRDFSELSVSYVSRNTVGHGVAVNSAFDLKSSLLGFLILDQILSYISLESSKLVYSE